MVVMFLAVIVALLLFLLALFFKGIGAIVEALISMTDVWIVLLLGVGLILALKLLVHLFTGGFGEIILGVIIIGAVIVIFSSFISVVLELLSWAALIFINILLYVYLAIDRLGELCEKGFVRFLGIINKRISIC